jgi:hypothetical protein
VEAREVDVRPVEEVDRAGLGDEDVEHLYVRSPRVGDPDEDRDGSSHVEERVQLDATLRGPEAGPGEEREAQVNRGGVQRVDGPLPRVELLQADGLVHVQAACLDHEPLSEVGIEAPIALLVGVGQRGPGYRAGAKAQVIELLRDRAETRLNVAQARPVRELGQGHAQKLIPAGEGLHPAVGVVAPDQSLERALGQMVHELCEHRAYIGHSWSWGWPSMAEARRPLKSTTAYHGYNTLRFRTLHLLVL